MEENSTVEKTLLNVKPGVLGVLGVRLDEGQTTRTHHTQDPRLIIFPFTSRRSLILLLLSVSVAHTPKPSPKITPTTL